MLIPEEEAFLLWLSQKDDAIPARVMREQNAPHYTSDRLLNLVKNGHVGHALSIDEETRETAGFYFITDEGRRALQEMQQRRNDRAAENANQRRNRTVQYTSAILGAIGGSLATLFFEHSRQIFQFLKELTY